MEFRSRQAELNKLKRAPRRISVRVDERLRPVNPDQAHGKAESPTYRQSKELIWLVGYIFEFDAKSEKEMCHVWVAGGCSRR